jgi:hypothetical protein
MAASRVRVVDRTVSPVEERAQGAYRALVCVAGRLEARVRVPSVGRWEEIVAAARVLLDVVEDARAEAVANARLVAAARREQLHLLPPGTVVEEDRRPRLRVCGSCDRETRAARCERCGVLLR